MAADSSDPPGAPTHPATGSNAEPRPSDTHPMAKGEMHKSCDRCGRKKRRCDGRNPCSRCIGSGEKCTFSKRRSKPLRRRPDSTSSASFSSAIASAISHASAGDLTAGGLPQCNMLPLKRCRLSASPATGLVGMEENSFLSDYFCCIGFLPLTNCSIIREAMVNIIATPATLPEAGSGSYWGDTEELDTMADAGDSPNALLGRRHLAHPKTCVFWCAVALGALVKGRSVESVESYCRLARDALASFTGPSNAEVAKAWAIMAYLYGFSGDMEKFHAYLKHADGILHYSVDGEAHASLPVGFTEIVKHGETVKLFLGSVGPDEVESFCNQELPFPQMGDIASEGELCRFVMQSKRFFEKTVYGDAREQRAPAGERNDGVEPKAGYAPEETKVAGESTEKNPHHIAPFQEGSTGFSAGKFFKMLEKLKEHTGQFDRLEQAVDRPAIRAGIGGLIINCTLAFDKVAKGDIGGALERLRRCVEVLDRYPGVCRFAMGAHSGHVMLSVLAVTDDPAARQLYDKLRNAFNQTLPPESLPLPPREEWQGISAYCDHFYCRSIDRFVASERNQLSLVRLISEPHVRKCDVNEYTDGEMSDLSTARIVSAVASSSLFSADGSEYETATTSEGKREDEAAAVSGAATWMGATSEADRNPPAAFWRVAPEASPVFAHCSVETRLGTAEEMLGTGGDTDFDSGEYDNGGHRATFVGHADFVGHANGTLCPVGSSAGTMVCGTEEEYLTAGDWLEVTHALLSCKGLDSGIA